MSNEYRIIPAIPLEYKQYEMVDPEQLAVKMTEGWTPVLSCTWINDGGGPRTRFVVGRDPKREIIKDPRNLPEVRLPPPDISE